MERGKERAEKGEGVRVRGNGKGKNETEGREKRVKGRKGKKAQIAVYSPLI